MTFAVYLGPTLDRQDAADILGADYLPPVRCGDVYRATMSERYRALVLIDGYFENTASVWHKEILFALANGVAVYGASSMGALRAAELSPFGMVGSGRIFEAYRAGTYPAFDDPFDGDDEVAVLHGPDQAWHLATLALVDMRETLLKAEADNVISGKERLGLFDRVRAIHYKDRTMKKVEAVAWDFGDAGQSFAQWVQQGRVSQKRNDAITLLRDLAQNGHTEPVTTFRFEWTAAWQRLVDDCELIDQ